jgi:DNA-binding LacI/PurR family transcriptional regulator
MSNDLTARLLALGIPVVNFNRGQDDARLTDITSDNVAGARWATEFRNAGVLSRIAHVMGWQGSSTGQDRAEGVRQAMDAAGLELVAMTDGMYARDTAAVARAMCEGPDRPDAIFVGKDHMVCGDGRAAGRPWAERSGRRVYRGL